jgi:hypothetical protein
VAYLSLGMPNFGNRLTEKKSPTTVLNAGEQALKGYEGWQKVLTDDKNYFKPSSI